MTEFDIDDDWPSVRYSLRSMLGAHGAAAAVCEFVFEAPLLAAVLGVIAGFILLQLGVLAVCTWHMPRSAS